MSEPKINMTSIEVGSKINGSTVRDENERRNNARHLGLQEDATWDEIDAKSEEFAKTTPFIKHGDKMKDELNKII